jgi:hypothetical protein
MRGLQQASYCITWKPTGLARCAEFNAVFTRSPDSSIALNTTGVNAAFVPNEMPGLYLVKRKSSGLPL